MTWARVAARTVILIASTSLTVPLHANEARDLVRSAWDQMRGLTSYAEVSMTIHRPTWERSMSMRAWTKGQKNSLVRITAPRKDAGNATLMLDRNMWSFSPKVNRVIKVPSSMMNQSWMGSDFSNKDVSRADDIVDQYEHRLLEKTEQDGVTVYRIESIPKEDAAVVWGKETLTIRSDFVVLVNEYYDQDGELVKTMRALEIAEMGGRPIATRQRMHRVDLDDEWTEINITSMQFDVELKSHLFTLSNLQNARD